ncbi:hypothetical protein EPIR_0721 [Erwinia piriflorinigrans CFBP 5888]|uniref:Uncharacterized protein n=1 Tax=Erwinia piriflorinigrans CFBP 5888 TaxID=1161919 RepID=V5Z589_9GAMM|nr:hypothetical protein EPIR_0721 [Erwinia piriflorinigrans CFBP 5888]
MAPGCMPMQRGGQPSEIVSASLLADKGLAAASSLSEKGQVTAASP